VRPGGGLGVLGRIRDGALEAIAGVISVMEAFTRGALAGIEPRAASRPGHQSEGDGRAGEARVIPARPEWP
jgi:hypothetical protein